MSSAELVVRDLRVGVEGRQVLDGIDLTVRGGEVHAVMGPNGSGKSTLAHVLMGRPGYQVVGGSVTLDGQDLLALPTYQRARAGLFLASQYPTELPGVSLDDLLSHALAAEQTPRDPTPGGQTAGSSASDGSPPLSADWEAGLAEEGKALGLSAELLDRGVNVGLSGGERKRSETLQLAILRPRLAVLDELDSGLDVDGLRTVARRVQRAVGEWGLGVLAITHYRRLLVELRPDIVHVLVHGRMVASGGPELADELERTGYGAYGVPGHTGPGHTGPG